MSTAIVMTRHNQAAVWWRRANETSGGFVRLRRASRIVDLMMEPATAELHVDLRLPNRSTAEDGYARTALIAGVLSHVRRDGTVPFAVALGSPRANQAKDESQGPKRGKALFSVDRATRLRRARTPQEALGLFRSAVALLGDDADVADLARYLIGWCDDAGIGGEETPAVEQRTRFALAYHRSSFNAAKA